MKMQTMMLDIVVVHKSPYYLSLLLFFWLVLSSFTIDGIGIEQINNNDEIKCLEKEKQALLELKNGIKVDRCGLLASWGNQDKNKDCCKWQGVRCNQHTGNVIMLDLHGIDTYEPCMEGNISPSLLELKHLNYLDLSYNDFQGQVIPSFIGSLTELEHLNLSYSGFWGEVPPQLGNLSNLQSLHLSCISLFPYCQHVENLWWLSHLTQLRYLDVINIDLSKAIDWVQVINTLPYLTFLRVNSCKLPSPSPFMPKMSSRHTQSSISLQVLDLGNNNLNSSIYQWLFKSSDQFSIRELEMINFSHNQIEGPLPDALGNLPALQYLDLSANHIECSIPDTIGNVNNLVYLDLSENNLQGCTLPKTFGNLCSLQSLLLANINLKEELSSFVQRLCAHKSSMVLDLIGNQLWGSLPDFFNVYPSMKVLYVDENDLNGTISKSIGQLSELERLSLSSNSVKETLSDLHFERLYKLQYLDLSNNSLLVLNFSANWVPPFHLDAIRLRSCNLGPHFPQWLQTQNSFSYLDISDAGISEAIPTSFWNNLPISKLSYLNMSHNKIPGTVPNLSVSFNHLNPPDIDLSSNSFKGAIPSFLGNVSTLCLSYNMFSNPLPLLCPKSRIVLIDVDLSNNLLSGELPNDCWVNAYQLSFLNLESNLFSGRLPTSLGTLKQLKSFRLCDNFFSGELPVSLQNCTSLVILDIGDNHFSGHIPSSFGDVLQKLVVLNLRKNSLVGNIPLSICKLSNLQILELSGNSISGVIPKCIHNFSAMMNETNFLTHSTSKLSQRRYKYPYAAWVSWKRTQQKFGDMLGLVKSFNVSDNELEGEIPTEISFLAGLVSLDLSRNRLSGRITPKIGQLTALEVLDLSHNQLCGKIPMSLSNLSYLGILDLSKNNLSGKIPIGTQLQSFDASSYMGNPELCGAPLSTKCPGEEVPTNAYKGENTPEQEDDKNDIFPGLYISISIGFVVGFWGVCGTLMLKIFRGHDCLKFVDKMVRT